VSAQVWPCFPLGIGIGKSNNLSSELNSDSDSLERKLFSSASVISELDSESSADSISLLRPFP
jgi:hypothetical protein